MFRFAPLFFLASLRSPSSVKKMAEKKLKTIDSLIESVLKLRMEYIFPFYCVVSLLRLVRRNFVPVEYTRCVIFHETTTPSQILSVLTTRPRLSFVHLMNCSLEIVHNISHNHSEIRDLSIRLRSPLVFTDFVQKLSVHSKSLRYLFLFSSDVVDDAGINCVLSHFSSLDVLRVKNCDRVQNKPTVTTNALLIFQQCRFVNVQDIVELVFHNMKCTRRMTRTNIETSVMVYFTGNAWDSFKTHYFEQVFYEKNENYKFACFEFVFNDFIMVCVITSTEFRFFRISRVPFPKIYAIRWNTKEKARNFFFYEPMAHLIE